MANETNGGPDNALGSAVRTHMERAYQGRRGSGGVLASMDLDGADSIDWRGLKDVVATARRTYALVGELPPQPPTFRGRVGTHIVKAVRRLLFWYTPPIVQFHYAAVRALEEQNSAIIRLTAAVKELTHKHEELLVRYSLLRQDLDALRGPREN